MGINLRPTKIILLTELFSMVELFGGVSGGLKRKGEEKETKQCLNVYFLKLDFGMKVYLSI